MSAEISNFFKSEKGQLTLFIGIGVLVLAAVIGLGVFLMKRAYANGATTNQIYTGKKGGESCSSNAMCATNKCVNIGVSGYGICGI